MTNATQEPDLLQQFAGTTVPTDLTGEARVVSEGPYVNLWDSKTGEMITQKRNILGKRPSQEGGVMKRGYGLLGQTYPDGTYRWLEQDPHIPPRKRREIPCYLHPDSPYRALADEWGFEVCRSKPPSRAQLELHMKAKHRSEWAAFEREERDRKEQEAAQRQELQTQALLAAIQGSREEAPKRGRKAEADDTV